MKKRVLALWVAATVAFPAAAAAQGLGIAGRVGTLGFGGDVAMGVTERLVIRGGMGLSPFEVSATIDNVDVTLTLPTWYNVGVDLYLNGAFRVGAGLLFKPDDFKLTGDFDSAQNIGGMLFTPQALGTLTGVVDSRSQAPYVRIGLG